MKLLNKRGSNSKHFCVIKSLALGHHRAVVLSNNRINKRFIFKQALLFMIEMSTLIAVEVKLQGRCTAPTHKCAALGRSGKNFKFTKKKIS